MTESVKRLIKHLPLFSPLGPLDLVIRRLINYRRINTPIGWGNHKIAWSQINKSLDSNTPEYALIAAWSILEQEVKTKGNCKLALIGKGRQSSIVDCTADSLGLNQNEKQLLKLSSKQRADSAHSLDRGNGKVSWNTVNFVLRCANQLHTS